MAIKPGWTTLHELSHEFMETAPLSLKASLSLLVGGALLTYPGSIEKLKLSLRFVLALGAQRIFSALFCNTPPLHLQERLVPDKTVRPMSHS
jgi:hypothetical protein